uniref:ABC transporter domain-containing protein n=1 Tax=Anopheles minimus TaxID=112268 RepID=A0A182WCA7_9DIPT
MATSNWEKFVLLLWKNWILQKRHYIQTLFEILIPVLCCSILLLVRGLVDPEYIDRNTVFKPLETDRLTQLDALPKDKIFEFKLAYSPRNDLLEEIVRNAVRSLNANDPEERLTYASFTDAREMESVLAESSFLAGVEFDDSWANWTVGEAMWDNLTFSVRFPAELRDDEFQFSNWVTNMLVVPFSPRLRNPELDDGGSPSYYNEGFLGIQGAISRALLERRLAGVVLPTVHVQRYPYPPYYDDAILEALQQLLALIIVISFFYTCINTVKYITIEKEKQLKEAMKIMGLSNWLHWSAWFVKCLILLTVSLSLITILLCVPFSSAAIFENSDWTLIWFFFFIYSITTICFCFMISVFFSKANTAAGIAGLLWFVSQLPFNVSQQNYDEMGTGAKIGMCLLSNSGMSLAMFLTVRLEATAAGLRWSNLFEPATIDDGFNVGLVIIMLLVDAVIYLLIALYVEQVMPGEFGVARPWYFPFTKEFWIRKRTASRDTLFNREEQNSAAQSRYIEQDPVGYAGVEIKQLRKVYKGNKAAVDGLNLRMYENQISVLLGHNGAGKTTTMSMLTGVFSPTSGTALINGHDIRTDIEGVRSSLGLCPQHNVLFDEMTVDEHLKFFSRLKGVPKQAVSEEIDRYLKLLELVDKRAAQSHTLSGGMKRKLAVGMALCGGSKVVLLDEPTSGMDPSARRALWNLLQKEKQHRTMLLSTHFMDEADVLGDRIAIMAEGKLKAVGSPFFLKKTFGVGYRLICVKDSHCDKQRLLAILRKYIPDVTIDTDIGSELSFVLKEDYLDVFQRLLEDIEQQMTSCGITSYGISLTTMEEVFLKAGSDSFDETGTHINGTVVETGSSEYALDRLHLLTGKELLLNQVQAQLLKKYLSTIRAWIQLVMMFVIPIFFVGMTFIITRSISAGKDLPALDISMDSYEKAITVLERTNGDPARVEAFQKIIAERGELVTIDEDMTEYIVRKSKEDIASVNTRYFVGATIAGGSSYVGWFNNKAFHTAPLALNLIYNAILQAQCTQCRLHVVNKPLPYRLDTQLKKLNTGLNAGFQLAFNTGFAMAFVTALYIMFYIKERTSRAKLLQFVSGTNVTMFWLLAFIWDYTLFVLNSLIYIATVAIFQEEGWSTFEELGRAFLLLLFFGFAALPVTYLFSFLFSVSATGFVRMMFVNVLSGAIFFTAVNILKFDGIDLNDVAEGLEWVFMFFPNFVLSHGLNNLNAASSTALSCKRACELLGPMCDVNNLCGVDARCCDLEVFSFGKVGIVRNLLFCLLIGCVCFGLLFGLEYGVLQRLFRRKSKPVPSGTRNSVGSSEQDSDVLDEKRRIQNLNRTDIDRHNLMLRDVTKYYGNFQAVNNLSIGINHSECFGLLGINGAGKTTTFKMMTGDEEISSGDAWVKGISLRADMNRAHRQIGYCPQFDALLDDLTGRETLRIFALLRGVRKQEVKNVSYILSEELNFAKHLDKRTKAYSGGNKRKLSTALALLGNPSVVYLDEPTTGMDPGAKRQFWDVICKVRNTGKSIVLTSHSMEECEALCTRLAIMVNGEFKCLGSTQHLKNKFSKGFLLTVKVARGTAEAQQKRVAGVKDFVMSRFNGAVLKEEYEDSLTFHIPVTDLKWSQMFGLMEGSKDALEIEDYALGQTSLEQVFLFFTKYQRVTDSHDRKTPTMASTSRWSKFVLLLWKNWIIQKRHYIQTVFEILIPVFCCAMLIVVRGLVDPDQVLKPTIFDRLNIGSLTDLEGTFPPVSFSVAYSPQNEALEDLLKNAIEDEILTFRRVTLIPLVNARELESLLMQNNYIGGIEFPDSYANRTDLPQKLRFAVRLPGELRFTGWTFGNWRTNFMVVPFVQGLRNANQSDGGSPNYFREGFLTLQAAISRTFIRRQNADYPLPDVSLQRFPYPPYYEDLVLVNMERLLPMIILISFFYTCINTVKFITIEKEKQLKEAMKIMGLPNWLHWTAWFVRCLILLLITISLLVFLISANLTSNTDLSVIEYADWTVLWFFFFTYILVTICFCFMMSVFFDKANTAAGIAGLMWFLFAIPSCIAMQDYDEMAMGTKIVSSLLSNTAMSFGIKKMIRLEASQVGLQWSNLFSPPSMGDDFSVGLVVVMFVVDALLYLAIALYFEQVMPGEFGVAKPWNFLFTGDFWKRNRIEDGSGSDRQKMESSVYFEQEPNIERAGVRIVNLRKAYGKKVAVDELNLNMYDGQITVLLGHNGAGKTTTMSMLTGMFSPTSGTALVNGYDIRKDIEGVRFSLGLCPQHNVLFNELTVAEHLRFFSQLKGVPRDKTESEIEKYVTLLELTDKRNAQSHTLSGGMKRKLGVGIALCGGSKVVLLDEPTSGMDPSARRALWDLIQKEKVDRTVILSTHFMDEADVLGDRIAIMAEGKLRAIGSPFFLKKSLGAGYRLVCVKDSHCDKQQVLDLLRKHIPEVRIETDTGTELSFVLREDNLMVTQPMLEELENNMSSCGISSYGISLTTMEEVFLRAGSDSNNTDHTTTHDNGSVDMSETSDIYSLDGLTLLDGSKRLFQQIYAQFYKKFLTTVRSWITLSLQMIIPVLFVLLSYLIYLNGSSGRDLPELKINFDGYTASLTVLESSVGQELVTDAFRERFRQEPKQHQLVVTEEDMTTYILNKAAQDIATFNSRYWVGASLNSSICTAWFNNKAYHSAPLAVNLIYNAILQSICPDCELQLSNKPLPYRLDTQLQRLETGANAGFQLAFNTGFAMAFVSALFILFYIKERTTRAKLLQFVSGVNVTLFWAISYLWDYLVFVLSALFYIVTLAIIQQDGWSTFDQLGRAFLVLLFYAFSSLPVTYLFAYLFHVPATGFVKMMLLNVLSGTIFFTAVSLLRFDGIDLQNVADVLEWIFLFFPSFSLTQSMNALNMVGGREALCQRACEQITICTEELKCLLVPQCCGMSAFTFDQQTGINRNLLFFTGIGLVSFAIILLVDYRLMKKIFSRKANNTEMANDQGETDSDVLEEKRAIAACSDGELASYNLVLKELSKSYGKFVAVSKLSVGVRHSECFGLLGINGAGKTSTFKMMTGDENITAGDAWVNGINLRTDMNRVHKHIGYCPQFDALLEDLTGRETLHIFALMRGVRRREINGVSLTLAEELNFTKHLDKRTKAYSGGNKRKLSTALALIGNPSVVYLDEPTTGMDPGAKRQFWNVICKIRNSGKSIVLTSHSMEECEALCTRLAIMVNGEFKCLGSTQHLKNKFSEGFLLTVKTKRTESDAAERVKSFVTSQFTGAVLKEEYQDSLTFHIARTNQRWSSMFGLMETSKDRLGIEDYALGQTTLEQVFLFFTKYQRIVD